MTSLTWFPQPAAQHTSTFFPATPSNPPITAKEAAQQTADASPPLPVVTDPFAFPAREYYTLHPPGHAPSRTKLYALSTPPPFTEITQHSSSSSLTQQQHDEYPAPFAKPVYRLPASCADVWNSVHRLLESKWARGEPGELSEVMKRVLVDVVEEEEKKKREKA